MRRNRSTVVVPAGEVSRALPGAVSDTSSTTGHADASSPHRHGRQLRLRGASETG
ncbi:MAG TPA: hypothetical protein VG142_13330 [Trebonia sp.]|nr:hypothetical protein [Trebonia sp.]